MKTILILFLISLISFLNVFSQTENVNNKIILQDLGEGSQFACQYLGSSQDFRKNYFLYNRLQNSGIEALDTLENDIRAIVCTDSIGKILWVKKLHTFLNKKFFVSISSIKIDDDKIILLYKGVTNDFLYFDSKIINENPQHTILLVINSDGNSINISFHYSDTKIPEQDILISNITDNGTFAFTIKKFGNLSINLQEISGESGIYLCKARINFQNNSLDSLITKKISDVVYSSEPLSDVQFNFNCLVLENETVIVYNPTSNYYLINRDQKLYTFLNYKNGCYFYDKNLLYLSSIILSDVNVEVKADKQNNVCIYNDFPDSHLSFDNYQGVITILNQKREIMRQDTIESVNELEFKNNHLYILQKTFEGDSVKNTSYNYALKVIDIDKNTVNVYSALSCEFKKYKNFTLNFAHIENEIIYFDYQIIKGWMFDWEKGCLETTIQKGTAISKLNIK